MNKKIPLEELQTDIHVLNAKPGFEELIDTELTKKLFEGLLPVIENDVPLDFPELHGISAEQNLLMSSACLLTGETGSGKHTLAYAFAKTVIQWIRDNSSDNEPNLLKPSEPIRVDDIFFIYTINPELLAIEYDMAIPQVLAELRQSFSELCLLGQQQNMVLFLLIENMEKILHKRKNAISFRHFTEQLLFQQDTTVFIAGLCEGKAEEIRDDCKRDMMLYECPLPSQEQQMEYLRRFTAKYINLRLSYAPEDILIFTENFTYGQMEQLTNKLLMIAKSRAMRSRYPVSHLLSDAPQENQIEIYPDEIEEVCNMVKNARYQKPLPCRQEILPPVLSPAPIVSTEQPQTSSQNTQEALKNIPTFNTIGDTMKAIKTSSSVEMPRLYIRDKPSVNSSHTIPETKHQELIDNWS